MASEADFFLRIGFLCRNDDEVDRRLGGGDAVVLKAFFVSVCNGPYSHVTSQSLSLETISMHKPHPEQMIPTN